VSQLITHMCKHYKIMTACTVVKRKYADIYKSKNKTHKDFVTNGVF